MSPTPIWPTEPSPLDTILFWTAISALARHEAVDFTSTASDFDDKLRGLLALFPPMARA